MSEQVNFVIEQYDSEELAEANELIGDMLINANIENKRIKAENAKLRVLVRDLERARIALCNEYPDRLGVDCEECPANVICDTDPAGRTRELGIEASE